MLASTPFQIVSSKCKIAIEPCKFDHPLDGVKEILNTILFKFNEDLGATPLSYENVVFLPGKSCAKIFGESPWLHVEVQVSMTVFRPVAGQRMFGRVSQASSTHISMLVYGLFNAIIYSESLVLTHTFDRGRLRW